MGKPRPTRKLRISAYSLPPGHPADSRRLPDHGPSTRHHMVPRSQGGKSTPSNLLEVPRKVHESWHYLFRNMTPEQVLTCVATHWSPANYFDFIVLRQGHREIRLDRAALLKLMDSPPDRPYLPSFQDANNGCVRPVYRRRRKRNKAHR